MVPPTMPSKVASGATFSVSDAPASTRESTSRPSWSVPNQWPDPGAYEHRVGLFQGVVRREA